MRDKSFLQWIHARLLTVHGENEMVDYMHKLRCIIEATPDTQETPNIGTGGNFMEVPEDSVDAKLYQIIDDIDTGLDMFKPEMESFEKYVGIKIKEAHKLIHSPDGYVLRYTNPSDQG